MIRTTLLALFVLLLPILSVADDEPFGGVGLQVVPTVHGELVVLNVLEGAPAAEQGVQAGDLIYKVDDFELRGSDFGKVISEHLWGPVGSSVAIFYRRPGVAGEKKAILQRTNINPRLTVTPSVQGGDAAEKRME